MLKKHKIIMKKIVFFLIVISINMGYSQENENYPEEVSKFIKALSSLRGVKEVSSSLQSVSEIKIEDLKLPSSYALLPHLVIRRSGGGKPHEALATFQFELEKEKTSWISLEFLAWWIRDLNRSGNEIQLRPLAFPPIKDSDQLGNSLSFLVEIFIVEPEDDVNKILEYVGTLAKYLDEEINEFYKEELKKAYTRIK